MAFRLRRRLTLTILSSSLPNFRVSALLHTRPNESRRYLAGLSYRCFFK